MSEKVEQELEMLSYTESGLEWFEYGSYLAKMFTVPISADDKVVTHLIATALGENVPIKCTVQVNISENEFVFDSAYALATMGEGLLERTKTTIVVQTVMENRIEVRGWFFLGGEIFSLTAEEFNNDRETLHTDGENLVVYKDAHTVVYELDVLNYLQFGEE